MRPDDAALLATATRHLHGSGADAFVSWEWPGSGALVFILHGWGSSAARFTVMAEALRSRGWHVVAVDAPGHGASPGSSSSLPQFMASLDATARHFGPPQALIGHSLGALAIACRHAGGAPEWTTSLKAVALIAMPDGAEFLLGKFIQLLGISARTEQLLRRRFDARFHAQPADFASMPGTAHINAPLLLLHDRGDDIVPYEHSAGLSRQLPAAGFVTTEGLGHSVLTRDPATIARIVEFLT